MCWQNDRYEQNSKITLQTRFSSLFSTISSHSLDERRSHDKFGGKRRYIPNGVPKNSNASPNRLIRHLYLASLGNPEEKFSFMR